MISLHLHILSCLWYWCEEKYKFVSAMTWLCDIFTSAYLILSMILVWTEILSYTCVCCDIESVADGCSWRTREQNKMSHMHCCRTTECTMSHIVAGPQCTMYKQYDNPTKHNVRDLGLWDFAQSPARCDSDCNWSKVCLSSTHFPTSRLWYQRIQLGYSTVILPRHEFECNSSNYEGRHGAFRL